MLRRWLRGRPHTGLIPQLDDDAMHGSRVFVFAALERLPQLAPVELAVFIKVELREHLVDRGPPREVVAVFAHTFEERRPRQAVCARGRRRLTARSSELRQESESDSHARWA